MKYLLLLASALVLHTSLQAQCTVNYVAPNFQIQAANPGCDPASGRIEAINVTDGVAPFTYTLVETGATNGTGVFTGLTVGLYTLELRDACGTVRTRQVTLVPSSFSFTYTVTKTSACSDGRIEITPSPLTGTYTYGVLVKGDTVWSASPTIDLKLYKNITILVKDACGNVHAQIWNAPSQFLPYIAELQRRLQCSKFDIFPVFYGFNAPNVCLYEYGTNRLVACKQAPAGTYSTGAQTNFFDLPWGQYYVIVSDSCYRDSMFHPDLRSLGGSELNPFNWDCNTFSMHVDGPAPPASFYQRHPEVYGSPDSICLFNATTNQLISCKPQDTVTLNPRTGLPWPSGAVWDSLPYGSYYAWIYDPCMDSTFRIDSTVAYPFKVTSMAGAICNFKETRVYVAFDPGTKAPYTTTVYYPDGTVAGSVTTSSPSYSVTASIYSGPGLLKVVSSDKCGNSDTSYVQPTHTQFEKSYTVQQKCPGVSGSGGSGDINLLTYVDQAYIHALPTVIKKNGADTLVNYSYSGTAANGRETFTFANLLTGVYVVRYDFPVCMENVYYDTVEIKDYVYPTQTPDSIFQCQDNPFTFTFPVVGGLSPYTFQIVGSTPSVPSLISAVQSTPTFTLGSSQRYTAVQVRAIDRCGNSTIGDMGVWPMRGCTVLTIDNRSYGATVSNVSVKVYPNPSHEQFTIAISQKKKTNFAVEVVNTSGVVVYKNFFNTDKKELVIKNAFMPGMYVINVYDLQNGKASSFKQIIR